MFLTIVSGTRGQGKTTLVRQYVADAVAAGRSVGGVVSPAVFEHGERAGYDLLDLRSGRQRPLARVVTSPAETPTIGTFRFDEAALAAGNAAIVSAVQDGLDVIAIDELGPLELEGKGWAPALAFALQACRTEQELVVAVRASLADKLPVRFPSSLWEHAKRLSPAANPRS
jgi:nucleoside-triphosphatase THEP1